MPDFPKVATPAEVAAAILVDPATDKIDGSQVDASIASRSTLTQAQIISDTTPFLGASVATIKGKTDIIGASVALETAGNLAAVKTKTDALPTNPAAQTNLDVAISTRAAIADYTATRATKLDNLDAAITTRPAATDYTAARALRIDKAPAFVAPTEASVVMDGTVKTLFEITDVKSAEVEAWVDLTPMAGTDSITIRYSRKVKAAGTYAKYAEEVYTGPQSIPLLKIMGAKIYRDTLVTAQQAAIPWRTLDVQVIRAVEA